MHPSRRLPAALALALSLAALPAAAQTTEERFQDLFITAGYCTAFGAALGVAAIGLTDDPSSNLKWVATGASLGFLGGSILGSYVIFSPMLGDAGEAPKGTLLTGGALPERGLVVRPVYDQKRHAVTAVEGGMTLATF